MALSRYLLNELLNDTYDPFERYYDYAHAPRRQPVVVNPSYLRSLIKAASEAEKGVGAGVTNEKDQFKINLDVQHFAPDELNLKIIDDYVVVEGKHEEKKDKHGFISRQFTRRYKLPEDVNLDGISSTISSDGILSIVAPKKVVAIENERHVPIIQTNQPAIKQTKEGSSGASAGQAEKMES